MVIPIQDDKNMDFNLTLNIGFDYQYGNWGMITFSSKRFDVELYQCSPWVLRVSVGFYLRSLLYG